MGEGGREGGTTFILVILAVFVLICTLTFLSYLFFSEYKRWDHSICSSSSLHEKRNEPIQIQATHALPYRQFLIGEKDTIFRGFLSIVYTKMFIFLFLTRIAGPKRGQINDNIH